MKIMLIDFCGSHNTNLKRFGYSHGQIIEGRDVFEVAKELFDAGLNVMITHRGDMVDVRVDTHRFQQR